MLHTSIRVVFITALATLFVGCSRPAESTAPRIVIPEPPPPDLVQVAQEGTYHGRLEAGRKALDAKDYDTAITHLKQALTAKPKESEPHFHLGRAYVAKKDDAQAITAYGEALTANPRLGDAYLERAALLDRAGRLEDASLDYTKLIGLELDRKMTAKAYWLRGGIADRFGKRADYRYDREQAMKLDPDYAATVTGGDVLVCNHTAKKLTFRMDQLVNPDGTERKFPPGYKFTVPESNTAYLVDKGQHIPARSIRFTLTTGEGSKQYIATYEKGMSLEVHVHETDLPRKAAAKE